MKNGHRANSAKPLSLTHILEMKTGWLKERQQATCRHQQGARSILQSNQHRADEKHLIMRDKMLFFFLLLSCPFTVCSAWQSISRRELAVAITSAATGTLASIAQASAIESQSFAVSAGRHGCQTTSDPSKTIVTCDGDLLTARIADEVRLAGIAAVENGVSTSAVRNPSRFAPPWSYLTQTDSASIAWKSLQQALLEVEPTAEIKMADENYRGSGLYYLQARVDIPATGIDDIEFLLRPADELVLFRSASRTSVFVFPLQQQVSDGNRNLKRMNKIRSSLGWAELGFSQSGSSRL